MSIEAREKEILEEFSMFDDWMDKYEHIIQLGKTLPLLSEDEKSDDLLIKGCQSKVWLKTELQDGNVRFKADSDAIITKGIIALLLRILNHEKPKNIMAADLKVLEEIGLKEHLSPTRSNGLTSMIKQIKNYALVYSLQSQAN